MYLRLHPLSQWELPGVVLTTVLSIKLVPDVLVQFDLIEGLSGHK